MDWLKPRIGVDRMPIQVHSTTEVQFSLGADIFQAGTVVAEGLIMELIFALDFLEANSCTIELGKRLCFPSHGTDCVVSQTHLKAPSE